MRRACSWCGLRSPRCGRGGVRAATAEQAVAPHPALSPCRKWHGERTAFDDRIVRDLPDLLRPGDALVFNDTRVIRAALQGERLRGEARARVAFNLHKRVDESRWRAFARPAKRLAVGDRIRFGNEGRVCLLGNLDATVADDRRGGRGGALLQPARRLSRRGHRRAGRPAAAALHRRQARRSRPRMPSATRPIYARREGAVAAPTAGLHFTPELMAALDARGISRHYVTLHVGAGTFLPVKAEDTSEHRMHAEWGEISAETAAALNAARAAGGRIVAVGTTALRLLETAAGPAGGQGVRHRGSHPNSHGEGPYPPVRRRDGALHHAGLPLQGGRPADDQLPPAALDAVHAGRGLQRARRPCAPPTPTPSRSGYRFYSYGDACLLHPAAAGA